MMTKYEKLSYAVHFVTKTIHITYILKVVIMTRMTYKYIVQDFK